MLGHTSCVELNLVERLSTSAESRRFATQLQSTPYSTVLLATTLVDIILSASWATFITRELQRKPEPTTFSVPAATILGLNGAIAANSTKICTIFLGSPIGSEFYLETDAYVVE